MTDAVIVNQYLNGSRALTKFERTAADVNKDGVIDNIDSTLIMKKSANLIALPYTTSTVHKITYDLDGGTPIGILTEQYAEGIEMTIDTTLATKGKYVFIGWTRTDTDTPSLSYKIESTNTEDITLKANWGLLGDVDQNGSISVNDTLVILNYVNGKTELTAKEEVLADVNQDGIIDYFDSQLILKSITGSVSLPYDNSKAYKITYDLNGGTESTRNQKNYIDDFSLYEPTRTGYTFIGWTGSNGNIPQDFILTKKNGKALYSGDLHFKANWQKNS